VAGLASGYLLTHDERDRTDAATPVSQQSRIPLAEVDPDRVSRAVGVWDSRGYRRHQRHHGKHEPSKGYRMTTSEEHRPHEHADHVHGEGCGHEAVQHGDHLDYLHDEHRHAEHEGHYDEHGDA